MAYHSFLSHLWVSAGRRPIRWLASRARPCHTHCARYVAHIVAHCHTLSHNIIQCQSVRPCHTQRRHSPRPRRLALSVCAVGLCIRSRRQSFCHRACLQRACTELAFANVLSCECQCTRFHSECLQISASDQCRQEHASLRDPVLV